MRFKITTSARPFGPAIRAQEIATPAEHVQLVSKLHTIADGLKLNGRVADVG